MRVRTTLAATLVVGLALTVGAVALVTALRRSLTDDIRTALELRATDVASVLESGTPPTDLAVDDSEDSFLQVRDGDGRVVASSGNVAGEPPVVDIEAGDEARVTGLSIDDDEFLVVAVGAGARPRTFTVLAGRTLEAVAESTGFVSRVLLAGVPLLLLLVAATAWRIVGRALAPVEAMREEVDAISAAALDRRVPEPGGDDEIARLAVTMNRMLERLEDAQARERAFVSDASHELRSPVATIRQHAEVALAHPEVAGVEELAETVLAEDLRLQEMVDDLLFLARVTEDRRSPRADPVDVDDLVFEEATGRQGTTGVRIDTTGVSAGRVLGDGSHLRRVVRNLTDNAVRHARTTVALTLAGRDGWVVLTVDDDGPGIPPAQRLRVFERFVRLDEARARDGGGAGLGLSIVAEIAEAHGGSVAVTESRLGGARFEVRLPADPE